MRNIYLKEWREYLGLTQLDVAVKCKLERATVSRVESKGEASPKTVGKIGKGLGIDPQKLYSMPDFGGSESRSGSDLTLTKEKFWEGFDSMWQQGELTLEEVISRSARMIEEMKRRGMT